MKINFEKYQGAGNDFILIDNRAKLFPSDNLELIKFLCDRKFGIGSDGLMLFQNTEDADFRMIFFNPDGSQSLCGNGSRCAIAFANALGIIGASTNFITTDGEHEGRFFSEDKVSVNMRPVRIYEQIDEDWFVFTGSPHYVKFVKSVDEVDVEKEGRIIRNSNEYKESGGTNVNFVEMAEGYLKVRTYERGVEAETLSCGTGVTAVALAAALRGDAKENCKIKTAGGDLEVSFKKQNSFFDNIWLTGPAKQVYSGNIDI